MTLGAPPHPVLFLFVRHCEIGMDKAVPGFECSKRLSFQCDEFQVLGVRRDFHKAYWPRLSVEVHFNI
jgi:hypothetical protein